MSLRLSKDKYVDKFSFSNGTFFFCLFCFFLLGFAILGEFKEQNNGF